MWPDDDLMLGEPSLMSTGICPMSVFDKFDWDCNVLGPDPDALLGELSMRTDNDIDPLLTDVKTDADFDAPNSIFGDSIKNDFEFGDEKISKLDSKSIFEDDPKFEIKEEPIFAIKEEVTFVEEPSQSAHISPVSFKVEQEEITDPLIETSTTAVASSVTTITTAAATTNSIIRIPVKRNSGCLHASLPGTGRPVKAVVVGSDRSKSIVCNVVRNGLNKGIIIQKTTGGKLPIKVNLIASKDSGAFTFDKLKTKSDPVLVTKCDAFETKIKTEFEEVRPETPQSLIGSDEEFLPFTSPAKNPSKSADEFPDNFMKTGLMADEGLSGDLLKCMPLAEVTGQMQHSIPDVFKYTPNNSPTSNTMPSEELNSFYSKLVGTHDLSTATNQSNHFYSKAAAIFDHDYGFTCRTPKTNSIFSTESLGIQTPSASEPPTDSGK